MSQSAGSAGGPLPLSRPLQPARRLCSNLSNLPLTWEAGPSSASCLAMKSASMASTLSPSGPARLMRTEALKAGQLKVWGMVWGAQRKQAKQGLSRHCVITHKAKEALDGETPKDTH